MEGGNSSVDPSLGEFYINHQTGGKTYFFNQIRERNKGVKRPDFLNIFKKQLSKIKDVFTTSPSQFLINSYRSMLQAFLHKSENNSTTFVVCMSGDESFSENSIVPQLECHQ